MSVTTSRSAFRSSLRPATWRGLSFHVVASETVAGRRVHVHEYPFRDDPWPEDLGRRTRQFSVKGFLVGDDVADRLRQFQDAAEESGSGSLTHPLRGDLDVTLLAFSASDAWDEGRIVRIAMEFVEAGERRFPGSVTDGRTEVGSAASAVDKASGAAGERGIFQTLREGYAGAQRMVRTAQGYIRQATGLVGQATGAIRSVTALAGVPGLGSLGRFIGGSSSGSGLSSLTRSLGSITSLSGGVSSALSRFNTARNSVTRLGDSVMRLVRGL